MLIQERLRELRKEKKETQVQVAQAVGLVEQHYQKFERGVNLFCARKFYEARTAFIDVLKQFRRDAAAREYLFLCNQYYQRDDQDQIDICIERF